MSLNEQQEKYQDALLYLYDHLESAPEGVYQFLVPTANLDDYITGNAINYLGILHDVSDVLDREEGLRKVLDLAEDIFDQRSLTPEEEARLEYTVGNAQTGLLRISGQLTKWDWENPDREEIIRRFRKALASNGVNNLTTKEIQKSYTNLGSALSNVGRWIEAFRNWRNAYELDHSFAQAKGQIGLALRSYALHIPHQWVSLVLLQSAHENLRVALESNELHRDMRARFTESYHNIHSTVDPLLLDLNVDLSDYSYTGTNEKAYREWSVNNRLFLNPINDVSTKSRAAQDTLHLPKITRESNNITISCTGFFNQIKQEYVSARYELWKGLDGLSGHFSDRGVTRQNTFDFPQHGLNIERIKGGYKNLYAIFDKIAKLLNEYFDLNYIQEHKLYFDNVWYKSQGKNALAPEFQNKENWPLRGLFWLSKDLEFGSELSVEDSLEPGAEEIRHLRNELEHGYVRILSDFSNSESYENLSREIAHDIHLREFIGKAMKIVNKSRAAIIYLVLGIHAEESTRTVIFA